MKLPLAKHSSLVAIVFLTASVMPQAQAQNRRARTSRASASASTAKLNSLKARLRKAVGIYNDAHRVANRQPVFQVQGKIERGDTSRLLVYGQTQGQNEAARNSLGQTNDDTFLSIHNPDPSAIGYGRYQGYCAALSQTEYVPAPADYFAAVATLNKYEGIIESLQQEVAAQEGIQAQTAPQRERARLLDEARGFLSAREAQAQSSTDPEFLMRFGQKSLALYNRLEPRDKIPALRENFVVQSCRAATLLARQGRLDQSGAALSRALWFDSIGKSHAPGAQRFGATSTSVFGRQPELLGALLLAWSQALPGYAKSADSGAFSRSRKIAQALLRCAGMDAQREQSALAATMDKLAASVNRPTALAAPAPKIMPSTRG